MTITINGTNGLIQAYDYQVLTTGFTYTFAAGTQVLVINPAGTLATGTITMPASPSDGMTITFSSTKIITALTVNANTGQTINNAVTTLSAGQSASYIYRASSTAWFPFTNVSTAASASPYVGPSTTTFTTTGSGQTFTIPTGITRVKVTVVAGGGAGGTQTLVGCSLTNVGSGGGAGGAAIKWLTGLTPGNTLTVTVGAAGGASSVASGTQTITTISATAGSAGTNGSVGGTSYLSGGNGGVGSSGDLNINGGAGGYGAPTTGGGQGNGGSSILGGGGRGATATVYGTGGAGVSGTAGQGVVIFEY